MSTDLGSQSASCVLVAKLINVSPNVDEVSTDRGSQSAPWVLVAMHLNVTLDADEDSKKRALIQFQQDIQKEKADFQQENKKHLPPFRGANDLPRVIAGNHTGGERR